MSSAEGLDMLKHKMQVHEFAAGKDYSDSDDTESLSHRIAFIHQISDASTASAVEVVLPAPAPKDAEARSKGKRHSGAARSRCTQSTTGGKRSSRMNWSFPHGGTSQQLPTCPLLSQLRAQGLQTMIDAKQLPPKPAKTQMAPAALRQHIAPPPGLPPPPGLEMPRSLHLASDFAGWGRSCADVLDTASGSNNQLLCTFPSQHASAVRISAAASYMGVTEVISKHLREERGHAHHNFQEEIIALAPVFL
eukprot:TRINITY_DN7321_c0_g2_i1.p1 TRINITY_DN7321_c0_g2~~TRINITY_DN7321_c0_g2_i1.p1  ORF type:complete len:249 (+),score=47.27 TRINITY_DN7321_c0_g2_i1:92-838(+)